MSLTLHQLAAALQLDYAGPAATEISGVASLQSARAGDLCFIQGRKYLAELAASGCGSVILPRELAAEADSRAMLFSDHPHYSFVQAIGLLGLDPAPAAAGIHPTAVVDAGAEIGSDVSIGATAIVAAGAVIGAGTSIGAGCCIESDTRIGSGCLLHPRVTLLRGVAIGDRCILHSGVVVGADGFGLVMHEQQWRKVPQLGGVVIEDDVEIGANSTIDRGALDDTVIESGCKLDNQIQVAHNVRIGAHTAIAACVGIAGSARIGRYCKISGAAVVLGHLSVTDHVTITAMSLVTKDIKQPGVYSSGTPLMENSLWHRSNARYKALEKIAQSVARLEKSGS